MTDYSELKRLAEALHGAEWQLVDGEGFEADNRFVTSQRRIDDSKVAFAEINYGHPEAGMGEPFQSEQVAAGEFIAAANPAAVLALIAEVEALRHEREGKVLCELELFETLRDSANTEADEHRQCMATYRPLRQTNLDSVVKKCDYLLAVSAKERT
jgi:hypothetical protein